MARVTPHSIAMHARPDRGQKKRQAAKHERCDTVNCNFAGKTRSAWRDGIQTQLRMNLVQKKRNIISGLANGIRGERKNWNERGGETYSPGSPFQRRSQ